MGVDLTLYPLSYGDNPGSNWYAFTSLNCERRRKLWPAIETLKPTEIPLFVEFMGPRGDRRCESGEPHYGKATKDDYGSPLTYLTAGALGSLLKDESVTDNPTNRAVWAYLAALPPAWIVVLWWH